jgi:hypothetical protein
MEKLSASHNPACFESSGLMTTVMFKVNGEYDPLSNDDPEEESIQHESTAVVSIHGQGQKQRRFSFRGWNSH